MFCSFMNESFEYRSRGGETLLNNRLLLTGITFAKMYDTSWQEPFCIKITGLINLTDVVFTQV